LLWRSMAPYSMAGLLSCAFSASSQCGAEANTSRRRPAASSYLEGAPPRFDHGVGELQFREGQDPAQNSRSEQVVDLGIPVLDARVGQHDRSRHEGVAPRLASTSTAPLFTGANVSATRHAKMRREKLSITACR